MAYTLEIVKDGENGLTLEMTVERGLKGSTYHPYTAYASDATGANWSLTPGDNLTHSATIHSLVVLNPPTAADFNGVAWVKIQGNPGPSGATYYPYQAWASDVNGTGWSLTPSDALKYMAIIHSVTELNPPTAADFANAKWQFMGTNVGPIAEGSNNAARSGAVWEELQQIIKKVPTFADISITANKAQIFIVEIDETNGGETTPYLSDGVKLSWLITQEI